MASSSVIFSMSLFDCSEYRTEHDYKYNSAKRNVMVFGCKTFKDIDIPNFLLNSATLPRVSKCKILGMASQKIYVTTMTYLNYTSEFKLRVKS